MSLVGKLEDLSLGEILQIVSLSRRSGLLRLDGPAGEANVYIRNGMILYAGRSGEKDGLLGLLVHHGLLDMTQLEPLKERLETCERIEDLKELVSNELDIPADSFEKVLKKRVEEIVFSLFLWEEGTFSFQLIDSEGDHPALTRMKPLFLEEGINAQFLVMEGARREDELVRDAPPDEIVPPGQPGQPDQNDVIEFHLDPDEMPGEESETRFDIPDTRPPLPERIDKVIVLVSEDQEREAELKKTLESADIKIFALESTAPALTRIQELRTENTFPLVVADLKVGGITDGAIFGALDILSTLWDLGLNLPVVILHSEDVPPELENKISDIESVTLIPMEASEIGKEEGGSWTEKVATLANVFPGRDESTEFQEVEYYDIQQELSDDLEGLDLPFDGLEEGVVSEARELHDPAMANLSSYVAELNREDVSGEVTLLALRFASEIASRAILFLVRKGDIKGLGQFGIHFGEGKNADSAIRSLVISTVDDSVFSKVIQTQQSYRGVPSDSEVQRALFEELGGGKPSEIYIGPIVTMGKVAVILYADDFPERAGLAPTSSMDIFLSHTGLALDRAFLEMKLKTDQGEDSDED
jgi:hypothetical protein